MKIVKIPKNKNSDKLTKIFKEPKEKKTRDKTYIGSAKSPKADTQRSVKKMK